MNCANHPDRERVAFCQNCGKPLCTECVRNVGTSVFCEPCLTARVTSTAPPTGYGYPTAPPTAPPVMPGEPNPGIAALLGFIPGVGAMYNEQYAKGIVHLVVFAVLVSLTSDVNGIFGLFIAGWEFYMVIEAHHTARARRDGTPLPNPFGLNDLSERLGFGKAWPGGVPPATPYDAAPNPGPAGQSAYVPPVNPYASPYTYVPPVSNWGAPQDPSAYGAPATPPITPITPDPNINLPYYRRFPTGAIWLIVLGLFFMVGNIPFFRFHVLYDHFLGPILLIGIGVWLFVRKMTSTGQGIENDGTPLYHWRLTQAINSAFCRSHRYYLAARRAAHPDMVAQLASVHNRSRCDGDIPPHRQSGLRLWLRSSGRNSAGRNSCSSRDLNWPGAQRRAHRAGQQ